MPQNPLIAPPAGVPVVPRLYSDFGPFLTYAESIKSATARRKGIDNTPTPEHYENMGRLYLNVFVPICNEFGKLPVSSFYRCPALNRAVGGSKTSQHMRGQAIDIDCDGLSWITNRQLFEWARTHLWYDQLLLEFPDANGNPGWVHISFVSLSENRKQVKTIS